VTRPVKSKIEAIKRIRAINSDLISLGVVDIGIFGSFARNEQSGASDLDILVKFAPEAHSFDNFMDLSFLLEEIMGRKVDVLTEESLSPFIGPHILQEVEHVTLIA
jgi:predicted nucleotidyltransferase